MVTEDVEQNKKEGKESKHEKSGLEFIDVTREILDPNQPAEVTWTKVNIDGEESNRLMLVLQSRPCTKKIECNSCAMCPFHANANPDVGDENLIIQCRDTISMLKKEGIAMKGSPERKASEDQIGQFDIVSSGSFFCDEEYPAPVRKKMLGLVASELPSVKKVVVESRAEFLDDQGENKLKEAQDLLNRTREEKGFQPLDLEYCIGIETTDPAIRNGTLHKMLDKEMFEKAFDLCKDADVKYLQTYLLVKPHFVTEGFAVADAVRSAKDVIDLGQKKGIKSRVALEPVFAGEATILDVLFKAGLYKPPNIWSVVEVAKEVRKYIDEQGSDAIVFVGLSDEGISKDRLTRGCDECDTTVKEAITRFNGSQKLKDLDVNCPHCTPEWEKNFQEERAKHPSV